MFAQSHTSRQFSTGEWRPVPPNIKRKRNDCPAARGASLAMVGAVRPDTFGRERWSRIVTTFRYSIGDRRLKMRAAIIKFSFTFRPERLGLTR